MKSRFLAILAFLLTVLLLTACHPTPPRTQVPQPPTVETTVIIEEEYDLATPVPYLSLAFDQTIDYSMYQPGTIFFIDEDGTLTNSLIIPELSQPEWDAQDFPKGFSTILHAGHWKKFRLGPASVERGFLVDVTPQEASTEGAEIVSQVMPEYDGESWVDVLWLFQPKEATPLPVYIKVYTTQGWPVVYHDRLNLEPGVWQGYTFGKSSELGGFVVAVSPQGAGARGDTLQRFMINPEFPGGWQDVLRIQIPQSQAPMQAEVAIYQTPSSLIQAEFTYSLQPGEWFTSILGLSEQQMAYVMKVTPLSSYDNQVESYGVQPVFIDGAWMDVIRLKIPADRPPMDVNMRVYGVGPDSHLDKVEQIPTTTPDRLATEWASYIHPSATPTPLPTAIYQAGCPGALPSRLQVGQSGIVSLDPPVANRVRREPDRNAEVLGQIMPGEKFTVLEGPRCADGWAWWRVRSRTQDLVGWTSEGDEETYWLLPVATPTPTVTPTLFTNLPGCLEPPAGLISWWPGDGNANDIQGVNNGSLRDGATFATGMVGQAFSFDGNGYISAPTTGLPTSDNARTMEFWVKVNSFLGAEAFMAGYGNFKSFEQTYHLGTAGSTLFFSQWGQAILSPSIQTGKWYHVAASNTDGSVKLYLNGVVVATGNLPMNTPDDTTLYIGRLPVDSDKRLAGLIDELSVYDRSLSAAEIRAIYNAGSSGKCKQEPFPPVSMDVGSEQNAITITAGQIESAPAIEDAIKRATSEGTEPGTVILDGRDGPFVYTAPDWSVNIFVSNLTLRGVNHAVIKNCADGLFFDNFPLENILVEGIEFNCEGSGVVASGAFKNVTLRNNVFRAGNSGIDIGGASSDWLITGNVIEAEQPGIVVMGAKNIVIADNHISGENGLILRDCSQSQVQKNVIQASYQGVLLAQESWKNVVQMNTITGVSLSGVALEPDVTGNQILENKVSCAPGTGCLTVDASPEVAEMNTITPISAENIAYSNDFENTAGKEWSYHNITISPTGRKFLGQFGNDQVILNLTNLPDHTEIRVIFDLYIIRSWDGNINPDLWQFKVDGQSLLLTTFDNQDFYSDHSQAYPDDYREGSNPPRTGAEENNTLGYKFDNRQMDATYILSFTIPHSSTTLELTFKANGLTQDIYDEGWGIDNVDIYTIK